eukprot:TRINITY_DN8788_c0_g3_i2.p1 TRINITY_DN8788_c0_g3~~TRINITY_DN8788_c0_g3_i2.p1  ORF type:complete len:173 (+),score=42.14 TRINITY_DN8788_c0_g3_i2:165-683(+)
MADHFSPSKPSYSKANEESKASPPDKSVLDRAAIKIQAVWRGYQTRKEHKWIIAKWKNKLAKKADAKAKVKEELKSTLKEESKTVSKGGFMQKKTPRAGRKFLSPRDTDLKTTARSNVPEKKEQPDERRPTLITPAEIVKIEKMRFIQRSIVNEMVKTVSYTHLTLPTICSV